MPKAKSQSFNYEITIKERDDAITEQKRELVKAIGKAQAILLLQKTPKTEIRKRLMNPSKPRGRGNPEFSYVEHAYVTEMLNWATLLNWDVIVESRERIEDEAVVHGYIEIRFPNGNVVKKYGSGGMRHIAANRNMGWADAFKGATSDMIKNCAMRLGLGLDLYRTEEEDVIEPVKDVGVERQVLPAGDDNDPAKVSQLNILKTFKVEVPADITRGQAAKLIYEVANNKAAQLKKGQ